MNARRALTQEEVQDTQRLQAVWDTVAMTRKITQKEASVAFGFKNQSAISQYLKGRIPLNMQTAAKFSQYLQVPLTEISPRFSQSATQLNSASFAFSLKEQLNVSEDCVLVEMNDENVVMIGDGSWYVLDRSVKNISEGAFAILTGEGYKLIKFEAAKGAYRVWGLPDQTTPIIFPLNAAALIKIEGKVLYKITKL
ncbi:HTH_XRE domain containing protein [uncultured Caudovirales phage]|uniref:HTH_XRE domain containing protein n=1 Tax=uncultured Caudovirales phage TaxID=2100421 RepID=A0A6J7WYY3_9CAUD|nr:HTH_XRE domain containing protein [uncultured Caudovirales phage]